MIEWVRTHKEIVFNSLDLAAFFCATPEVIRAVGPIYTNFARFFLMPFYFIVLGSALLGGEMYVVFWRFNDSPPYVAGWVVKTFILVGAVLNAILLGFFAVALGPWAEARVQAVAVRVSRHLLPVGLLLFIIARVLAIALAVGEPSKGR